MARVTLPSSGEVRMLKRGSLRILREPAETIRSPLYQVIADEPRFSTLQSSFMESPTLDQ